MNLTDTVELMLSDNYKDRFKGEYYQLKERYNRLLKIIFKYEAGILDLKPKCDVDMLKEQLDAMSNYLYWLEVEAKIEGIEL